MKKIISGIALLICFCQVVISQYVDHTRGGHFLKRTEFNITLDGIAEDSLPCYNMNSKSILDRILFDNTNSFVEFVAENPSEGIDSIVACRIVKDRKTASYKLEIMQIPNARQFSTTVKYISKKKTEIVIPDEWLSEIPAAIRDSINKHNKEAGPYNSPFCADRKLFKPYHPESKEYPVGKEFAETLHSTITTLIHNFTAEGIPVSLYTGYPLCVTFRCVVGAEVWTLKITVPQRKALLLSNIFLQIISDALNNEMNESEYIRQLEEIFFD